MEHSRAGRWRFWRREGPSCAFSRRKTDEARREWAVDLAVLSIVLLAPAHYALASDPIIGAFSVSRQFFNPTVGQGIEIGFLLSLAGKVNVSIVGPDGQPVRTLVSSRELDAGTQSLPWDGRDDSGLVVPDEAYSLRIDWTAHGRRAIYPPARVPARRLAVDPPTYDWANGMFSYTLSKPSRVELRATCLSPKPTVAFAKTVVAGEPRAAGSVVDVWNGFDDAGKVFLPDRPGFVVSIEVTELPEPAIMTIGNRSTTFRAYAARRKDASVSPGPRAASEVKP